MKRSQLVFGLIVVIVILRTGQYMDYVVLAIGTLLHVLSAVGRGEKSVAD